MEMASRLLLPLHHPSRRLLLPCFPGHFPASLRLLSTPGDAPPPLPSGPALAHFMVEYLVSLCGLSMAEAATASKYLTHIKSPCKPDAVLLLLKQEGLGDAHIRRLVLSDPRVLLADAEKTLEPKIRVLRGAGFSGSELAQLVSTSRATLQLRNVLPRVEFWRKLMGSNHAFLKTLEKSPNLLGYSPEKRVVPALSLLRGLGVPDGTIRTIVLKSPRLVFANLDRIKAVVEQAKNLGASPCLRLFAEVLFTLFYTDRSTLDAKSTFLRSCGWSEAELLFAFRRFPHILRFSEKKLRSAMDFLLKEAGCEPSYVACHPVLLGFSIQKRLTPRYHVLQSLKGKGLPGSDIDLYTAMIIPDKKFAEKFIIPNREKFAEIFEPYYAGTAKKFQAQVNVA